MLLDDRGKFPVFFVIFLVLGMSSGIYAVGTVKQDSGVGSVSVGSGSVKHQTFYVAKNGTDRNDGLNTAKAKRNIEKALEVAGDGDTIKVGPGVYMDNLNINKNVTLIGDTQNTTVIDANREGNCVTVPREVNVGLINFTLKNGNAKSGGGIHNSGTLKLKNVTITENMAECGGGIYNEYNSKIIIECSIIDKNGDENSNAGGIYNKDPGGSITIYNSTISKNRGYDGGGIVNWGSLTMYNSTIEDNMAVGFGGGICNVRDLTIFCSTIRDNNAVGGGGIGNTGTLLIEDSLIDGNTADKIGGGISNYFSVTVWNNHHQ